MSGVYVVVGSTHHIRLYHTNLSQEVPAKGMDTKDFGIKDGKVTVVEFNTEFLIWIGLKEGHIFEIDVRNGDLLGVKRL
ncbi:inositol-polyphosphate 5-phosphatase [Lentinula edodes]|uniref:Inositol-polyphosphate 5-phosphatase n=1 Tax=Lentinula edodes TaxID=5353 RepID=A0A1Q3ESR1_LENED|nr:inositol-polyphosphate 5-phosphatase [Lentinula edodes]